MIRQPPKLKEALEILAHHHVDFVVVGGVAAVLGGAPISADSIKRTLGKVTVSVLGK
jgi:hypothetical protein